MKNLFFFLITLLICVDTQAKAYQLKELIELAKVHPEVKIEEFEVEKAKTLFERINGETRPKLSILSGVGPNKSVTGNPLESTQSNRIDTVTYVAKIDLKVPLFAFNRQNDLIKAADGNMKVKALDVEKKEAQLIRKVKEYYYGFQYASSLNEFAGSTLSDLDDVLKGMKENKKKNSDEDFTKLTLFRSLAQVKKYEIEKGLAQGLLGLKYISQTEAPTVEQDWIEFNQRKIPTLADLNNMLAQTNVDLRKANIGVDAKTSFLTSEKKSQLPVFGIFSSYDWRETPGSTKQTSKFAYDSYNTSEFSIGVGLIWEIDFGVKSSNVSAARIDLESIKVQQAYAQKNLPIQIEKIYLDLVEAGLKATELEKSYKSSKKLLNNIATGVAMGITPAKDIIESYTLKAQIYQQFVEAAYNYEMKLAELSYEMGTELDPTLK
ncbi:TolC family protein [Bacteriovorax sp. PP10]|uniref:TolC family protein n=1 Tax=Bacteriovorax antarcticus TaxID=3088717 RepID=A0ABU5VS52_9BACT|nr:TolC family protein [Bacteriovorax sp. PP10]MEA9355831.1 TolC family protein [Bacteriovorax sp. PP10]